MVYIVACKHNWVLGCCTNYWPLCTGGQDVFQNELQRKLKQRKDSTIGILEEEEEGEASKPTVGPVLPFDADEEHVASWLSTYGYQR